MFLVAGERKKKVVDGCERGEATGYGEKEKKKKRKRKKRVLGLDFE